MPGGRIKGSKNSGIRRCSKCSRPSLLHSRCWWHFVKRFLERRDLLNKAWWKSHQKTFLAMLYARYRTIVAGETPGDIEDFIYLIEHGKRKVWKGASTRPPAAGLVQEQIRTLIRAIDRAAEKERERERRKQEQANPDSNPNAENERPGGPVRGGGDCERGIPPGSDGHQSGEDDREGSSSFHGGGFELQEGNESPSHHDD